MARQLGLGGTQGQDLSEIPRAQRREPPRPLADYARAFSNRDEAMARAYATGHFSQTMIARQFGVHRATVARALARSAL